MKYLQPLTMQDEYYAEIERKINFIFYEAIFKPIFEVFKKYGKEIRNDSSPVTEAIRSGRIYYDGEAIKGIFSARISKALRDAGGVYDKRQKAWYLPALPADMQIAIIETEAVTARMMNEIISVLGSVDSKNIIETASLTKSYERTIDDINKDWERTISKVAVAPQISPLAKETIAASWAENLDLYIQKWTDEEIFSLRQTVQANSMRGGRAENLERQIMADYGVSRRKAKFLARQETSLLMSKFQQVRYADVGVSKYKWSTAGDERTRPDHKRLNGKIFDFAKPPVTDTKTGARNNAGEDFNCRCIAIPIFEGFE